VTGHVGPATDEPPSHALGSWCAPVQTSIRPGGDGRPARPATPVGLRTDPPNAEIQPTPRRTAPCNQRCNDNPNQRRPERAAQGLRHHGPDGPPALRPRSGRRGSKALQTLNGHVVLGSMVSPV
jgi:hypothetical protein